VTKAVTFEAAHRMPGHGPGHPYGRLHGHSFHLEVGVSGQVEPEAQWVADFANLTAALQALASELDHGLLNDIPGLDVPTLERLCLWVAGRLQPDWPGLSRVRISRPSLGESCTLELS
jgi:6-pyruvoyltetrahydropterin/6-carboxytetrahydropterin synthase